MDKTIFLFLFIILTAGLCSLSLTQVKAQSTSDTQCVAVDNESDGTLMLTIDGPIVGQSYDYLQVAGQAQLGGTLMLVFADNYFPSAGQEFIVVIAAEGICGAFTTLDNNKGLNLSQRQEDNKVYIKVEN